MSKAAKMPVMVVLLAIFLAACGSGVQSGGTDAGTGRSVVNEKSAEPGGNVVQQDTREIENLSGQDEMSGVSNPQSDGSAEAAEAITPTQFLCYMLGNSEEFSFSYQLESESDSRSFRHMFHDGKTALQYKAPDINGKWRQVREVEKDGRVYYVVEGKKSIVSYKSPAQDILLHEMQKVCMNAYTNAYEENGKSAYEYRVSDEQESGVEKVYRFFMEESQLKELDILYDSSHPENRHHYTFAGFQFEPVGEEAFLIPDTLEVVQYDTELFPDEIPPWFE